MSKNYIDYFTAEEYNRYSELLDIATELKANAPKAPKAPRGPMTTEQKIKMAQARMAKAQAMIDELLAAENGENA